MDEKKKIPSCSNSALDTQKICKLAFFGPQTKTRLFLSYWKIQRATKLRLTTNNSTLSILVSHTTDDLVFIWLPEDKIPLAVDPGIELPQLELVSNGTGDCTSIYSTGKEDIKKCWNGHGRFYKKYVF